MWHVLRDRVIIAAAGVSIVYFVHADRRRAWLRAHHGRRSSRRSRRQPEDSATVSHSSESFSGTPSVSSAAGTARINAAVEPGAAAGGGEGDAALAALLDVCRAPDAGAGADSDDDSDGAAEAAAAAEERWAIERRLAAPAPAVRGNRARAPLRHAAGVYEALDPAAGRILAAKRRPAAGGSSGDEGREGQAAAAAAAAMAMAARWRVVMALRHPNLAEYFEPADEATGVWVLMEFCDGGSVAALAGMYGALPFTVVRRWARSFSLRQYLPFKISASPPLFFLILRLCLSYTLCPHSYPTLSFRDDTRPLLCG
jgi:hypothetical protein